MTYDRRYGQREGLPERLGAAAENLARNKSLPWLGLGLYEDLLAAAAALKGQPVPAARPTKTQEYDL